MKETLSKGSASEEDAGLHNFTFCLVRFKYQSVVSVDLFIMFHYSAQARNFHGYDKRWNNRPYTASFNAAWRAFCIHLGVTSTKL